MRIHTRRSLCRSLFMVLCVFPTLLVSGWAIAVNYPHPSGADRKAWEHRLATVTGLSFRIASVEREGEGAVHLLGVQVQDPETGATIAEVRRLQIRSHAGASPSEPAQLVMTASQPSIRSAHLPTLWRSFHQRVLQGRAGSWRPATLKAAEVTLMGHAGGETYHNVQLRWHERSEGPQAVVSFLIPWLEMATPAQITVGRDRNFIPPQTELRLTTGPTPLPCSILADFLPTLGPLGEACRFRGSVRAISSGGGWRGDWEGEFHEVDLESVVTNHFPHTLRGRAVVGFENGSFRSSRLVAAKGWIDARDGVVGTSLVRSLARQTGSPTPLHTDQPPLHTFSQLRLAFSVDEGQLQLHGNCSGVAPGAVLTSRSEGVLLSEPPEPVPVVALVRALVPASQVQVPATEETHWLLDALPLPHVAALPLDSETAPPSTPLRIRPRSNR